MEASCRELLSSEGWRRFAETRAAFHRYSFGNCMLIAMQRPDATQVAGFKAWQSLGRQVRKGERAHPHPRADERQGARRARAMRLASRSRSSAPFRSSTSRRPTASRCRRRRASRSPATRTSAISRRSRRSPRSLGYTVGSEALEHAGGYCDDARTTHRRLGGDHAANARVRVLVHELAHALGVGYKEYGREVAEVIVETATVVVCGALGLDTSGESIPYIAGLGRAGPGRDPPARREGRRDRKDARNRLRGRLMDDPSGLGDCFHDASSDQFCAESAG